MEHFVLPGKTITSDKYHLFCEGKGLNQSIALSNARAKVFHAGRIGQDGKLLIARLITTGVDTTFIEVVESGPSGQAIIQVDKTGQNSIIIHGGANQDIRSEDVKRVLNQFTSDDCLLLQNEINGISEIIDRAKKIGLTIFLNPAPMDKKVLAYPLDKVDYFIINEIEGRELTGETKPDAIIGAMLKQFPRSATVLTLGGNGVIYGDHQAKIFIPAEKVTAVDTTAVGDTFIGFFIAQKIKGQALENCLRVASRAAAICVTRIGAADSIPLFDEVF